MRLDGRQRRAKPHHPSTLNISKCVHSAWEQCPFQRRAVNEPQGTTSHVDGILDSAP